MPDLYKIDKIFLLHHNKKPERLLFQKKQLESLGVKYTVWNSTTIDTANGFQNKALKSCYASHLAIIESNLDNINPTMILEDDAVFQQNIAGVNHLLQSIMDHHEWDMIYLYPTKFPKNIIKNYGYYSSIRYILNCHAYILFPKRIKEIYEILKHRYDAIDLSVKKLIKESYLDRNYCDYIHPKYKIYASNQPLVTQDRNTFGSQLGWGWNNRPIIID